MGLILTCWSRSVTSSLVDWSGILYWCINSFACASTAFPLGNSTWCQISSYSHTISALLFSSLLSLSQKIWSGVCNWFSGLFAGRICILVLWHPFSSSLLDGCTRFRFLLLPLLLLLLLAILSKKVESNVTIVSDETPRLGNVEE